MTKLSATATAILEAYENSPREYYNADLTAVAAVLREIVFRLEYYEGEDKVLDVGAILDVADELEADSKENKRPDRLVAGDVWEFDREVQVKGKRKPKLQKLKFRVIGYHHGQCAWQLMSLDGEHYCYLWEFAPGCEEDMKYIGHLDQEELEALPND